MIFVTVGTHEQQFNRLVECVDKLKENGLIEEVIIQTGFCTYEPRFCKFSKLFPYKKMLENVHNARIVITHGGPSSFIMPLQEGKIPIVVPRKFDFGEHVNNHQVDFCRAVADRQGNIIVVEDIKMLGEIISDYDNIVKTMNTVIENNNLKFNAEFEKEINTLF